MRYFSLFLLLFLAGGLIGCAAGPSRLVAPEDDLSLIPSSFAELPGWETEDHLGAIAAFRASCESLVKRPADRPFEAGLADLTYGDWHAPCNALMEADDWDNDQAKAYFEAWFTPYQARGNGHAFGRFTGYYEPLLKGSYQRSAQYNTPIRGRPDDLVSVNLGAFREDLKGYTIAGRVDDGKLVPYPARAEIIRGAIPRGTEKVLLWVDDPIDAFFLQIQGSGIVQFEDGTTTRVGYDGQNGQPYFAIGRSLVQRGALAREEVSLDTIRRWMVENPDEAVDLMNENRSYIFFRLLEGVDGSLGAQGVPLKAHRSLAVDDKHYDYGFPVYTEFMDPEIAAATERDSTWNTEATIKRLMVAQDTGGAIRGPVRGDYFWGAGDRARQMAGLMNVPGKKWLLLPR